MSAHTPGPYTVNVARLSDGSINVVHVLGPKGQGLAQIGDYGEAETLANAALFAAAPDLLAMLMLALVDIAAAIIVVEHDRKDTAHGLRQTKKKIDAAIAALTMTAQPAPPELQSHVNQHA